MVLSVWLQQQWNLEALSWSSSWPSRTTDRHYSNPWSKFFFFSFWDVRSCETYISPARPHMKQRWPCSLFSEKTNKEKKRPSSYGIKARVPFQHKTRTVQLSALAHFLFFRISPPTHSPHNINLISSFSFLAISNCFHFSTTLILDWRPTSFCCVRAKCWIGISPLAALGWHITFFSGHVGGLRLSAWDIFLLIPSD